jgi:hypothetical protein
MSVDARGREIQIFIYVNLLLEVGEPFSGKLSRNSFRESSARFKRAARLGLAGAMITEYPLEHRRYDQTEYKPFWAAAPAPCILW